MQNIIEFRVFHNIYSKIINWQILVKFECKFCLILINRQRIFCYNLYQQICMDQQNPDESARAPCSESPFQSRQGGAEGMPQPVTSSMRPNSPTSSTLNVSKDQQPQEQCNASTKTLPQNNCDNPSPNCKENDNSQESQIYNWNLNSLYNQENVETQTNRQKLQDQGQHALKGQQNNQTLHRSIENQGVQPNLTMQQMKNINAENGDEEYKAHLLQHLNNEQQKLNGEALGQYTQIASESASQTVPQSFDDQNYFQSQQPPQHYFRGENSQLPSHMASTNKQHLQPQNGFDSLQNQNNGNLISAFSSLQNYEDSNEQTKAASEAMALSQTTASQQPQHSQRMMASDINSLQQQQLQNAQYHMQQQLLQQLQQQNQQSINQQQQQAAPHDQQNHQQQQQMNMQQQLVLNQLYHGIGSSSDPAVAHYLQMYAQGSGGSYPEQSTLQNHQQMHQQYHYHQMMSSNGGHHGSFQHPNHGPVSGHDEMYQYNNQHQYGGLNQNMNSNIGVQNSQTHHYLQNQSLGFGQHVGGSQNSHQQMKMQMNPSYQQQNTNSSHLMHNFTHHPHQHHQYGYQHGSNSQDLGYYQAAHYQPFYSNYPNAYDSTASPHILNNQYIGQHSLSLQQNSQTMQQLSHQLTQQFQEDLHYNQQQSHRDDSSGDESIKRCNPSLAAAQRRRALAQGGTKMSNCSLEAAGRPGLTNELLLKGKQGPAQSSLSTGSHHQLQQNQQNNLFFKFDGDKSRRKSRAVVAGGNTGQGVERTLVNGPENGVGRAERPQERDGGQKSEEEDEDESSQLLGEAIEKRGQSAPAKYKFFKKQLKKDSAEKMQMQMAKLSQNCRDLDNDIGSQGLSPGIQRLKGFDKITKQDGNNPNQDDELDNSPRTTSMIESLFTEIDQRLPQKSAKLKLQHGGSTKWSEGKTRKYSGDIGTHADDIPAELRNHEKSGGLQRSNSNSGPKFNQHYSEFNVFSKEQGLSTGLEALAFGDMIDPQQRLRDRYRPRRRLSTVESEKNLASMGLRMNAQGGYEQINSSNRRKEELENQDEKSNHIKIEDGLERTPEKKLSVTKRQVDLPEQNKEVQNEQINVDSSQKQPVSFAQNDINVTEPIPPTLQAQQVPATDLTSDQPNQTIQQAPPQQVRGRGESSFSTCFDDPQKYWQLINSNIDPQDQASGADSQQRKDLEVKKDLQMAGYEAKMNWIRNGGPQGSSYRKRLNSGGLIQQTQGNFSGHASLLLENIVELDEPQVPGKNDLKSQGEVNIRSKQSKGIDVNFLKNQFSSFTLDQTPTQNDNENNKESKTHEEAQKNSRKNSENIEGQVLAENSKSSRKLSSSNHSNSQTHGNRKISQAYATEGQLKPTQVIGVNSKTNALVLEKQPSSQTPENDEKIGVSQFRPTVPLQISLREQVKQLPRPEFKKPSVNLKMSIQQIGKKYGLNPGYDSLEGQRRLLVGSKRQERMELFQYSSVLAKDQGGCRFLQQQIQIAATEDEEGNQQDREVLDQIFDYSVIKAIDLMVDSFGNYLIQKLVEYCSKEQLTMVIQCLEHQMFFVCKDSHGTRSIQKLIETVNQPIQFELMRQYFQQCFIDMCYDINGNHVLQKILKTWTEHDKEFIYEAMNTQCVQIACHKHGCCIMQKCIDQATPRQLDQLTRTIAGHTLNFIVDPYANYVVQYVLQLRIEHVNQQISDSILKQYVFFSKQKFSSNVIEKCLEFNSDKINKQFVRHIMIDNAAGVYPLLSHQFGNYVIQKCLAVCKQDMIKEVIESIKAAVRMLPHGGDFERKIYQRLVKKYPAFADPNTQMSFVADLAQEKPKAKQQRHNQKQQQHQSNGNGGQNTQRYNQHHNNRSGKKPTGGHGKHQQFGGGGTGGQGGFGGHQKHQQQYHHQFPMF